MHCRDAAIKHRNRVPLIRSAALRSWLTQRDPDEGTRTQTWKRLTLCSNPGTMGTFIYFSDSNGSAEKYPNARDAPTLEGSTGKSSPSARSLVSLMPAIQDGRVHLSRDVSFLIRAFHRLVHQSVERSLRNSRHPPVSTFIWAQIHTALQLSQNWRHFAPNPTPLCCSCIDLATN